MRKSTCLEICIVQALQFRRSIPRYALLKFLGRHSPRLYTGRLGLITLRDVDPPKLPGPQWVRITPKLAGICGSDLATLTAKGSPYLAPVTSMPFVLGHEVVGEVSEVGTEARDWSVGDRVVLHPALGCQVRGIEPMCAHCRTGRDALCQNVARGIISSGIQTGYCRDTGGGFSGSLVAHRSQLYRVPPNLSDRAAVLIEPFACALHAALRTSPLENDTVLVIGCGSIGLLTIAALRALGCKSRILVVARYDHQRALAKALGADECLASSRKTAERYALWSRALDAEVLKAELGKPMVIGGANYTFDCAASSQSIDDGIRFTRGSGTFVLVGMPGTPFGVDWTPMWFKELTVCASYAYGPENRPSGQQDTFELAIDLMKEWAPRLESLVGKPHAIADYRAAFASALRTGHSGVAKTVFAPTDG